MDNNQMLLNVYLRDSYSKHHVRELGRMTGLHPNTIITVSDELVDQGLLMKSKDESTNRVMISANLENSIFNLHKIFYNIQSIYESGLINYLKEKLSLPTIILFGSHAKADNRIESDIDLFVLCDKIENLPLQKFEQVLRKEIQLFIHTRKSFEKLKKQNPELCNNIVNGFTLEGFIEVV